MGFFRFFLRKKQSKGYGIHSPFAFDLITNLLYSPYGYYAYTDIARELSNKLVSPTEYNRLSFRLVNHFKVKKILEINPENEVNRLFIKAASSNICYSSVDEKALHNVMNSVYDAIFINIKPESYSHLSVERLLKFSNKNTFWVLNHIEIKRGKHFWRDIVDDSRVSITFDMKEKGIAFLDLSYHKSHYLI